MLTHKRNQIRSNKRREEIINMFSFKRKELVSGKVSVFKELFKKIEAEQLSGMNFELIAELLACLKNYPEEENTYILISNYLFDHNNSYPHFFSLLTSAPHYLENHMQSLNFMAFILSGEMERENREDHYKLEEQMIAVLATACDIIRQMISHLKRTLASTSKEMGIWKNFISIITKQLNCKLFNQVTNEAIVLFGQILRFELPVERESNTQLLAVWNCLKTILNCSDYICNLQQLLSASSGIYCLILKDLPQQREACLQILRFIILHHPFAFMGNIFRKELIKQVIYLLSEIPSLRSEILNLMKLFITESNIDQLLMLLNFGAHKVITEVMEWSMDTGDNQCLESSLISIYSILHQIEMSQELKLLYRVQGDMQALNFDKMLENLSMSHQSQGVERFVNTLIDDFYSCEVD